MPEEADLWQEGAAKQRNPAGECGKAAESRTLLKRTGRERTGNFMIAATVKRPRRLEVANRVQ
jgi:hypothetical protein